MNNKSLNKLLAIAILFGTAFSANACDIVVRSGSQKVMNAYGVVAQMPVAAEVGSGDERDELGSG